MVDSKDVLDGLILVYTFYALAIISVIAWFAIKITGKREGKLVKPGIFYTWVCLLIVLGVSIHIFTYNTIPWSPIDLNRKELKADKVFDISVKDHRFNLPDSQIVVKTNEMVLFNLTSEDLTYGFGLFREDNSMVLQMQVIPGHVNDILWKFEKPGIFSIRSTEYSGPKGAYMFVKDAVVVTD